MYQAQSFDHLRGLAGMSDGQIKEHLELYAGYVKHVNELTKELAEMHNEKKVAGKDFALAEATRRLSYEYDGMVLHEQYFSNLKPGGAPRPTERQPCGRAIAQAYGSIERWQENFKALGGMRGVGWVILFQDPQNGSLTNYWVSLHQDGIPARCKPLVVMDVWEHAFMRDYRASERLRYVDAFFTNIDWTTVERRFNEGQAQRSSAAA